MPKSANQKLKILYLMKILQEKTDETHQLSVPQLIRALEGYGIKAERKSLYDDIEALRLFGVDVESVKSRTTGYYIANRDFELAELKLLVDSVQASKFITHKKSLELIKKIESLTSRYEAQTLQRQVYVSNRVKNMNESIYYSVDRIHSAIAQNRRITFKYVEYLLSKERIYRRGGENYLISPLALTWNNENYYMLGFDSDAGIIKHYRVDKMMYIEITDEAREGLEEYAKIDLAVYVKKVFSMFSGSEEVVKLQFANDLVGVVIDRFGKDVTIMQKDECSFVAHVRVFTSPQFFGWLCAFGGKARILSPQRLADEFRTHVASVLETCRPREYV
jgi:predicted DNA-binding transcriptional regulator YafY